MDSHACPLHAIYPEEGLDYCLKFLFLNSSFYIFCLVYYLKRWVPIIFAFGLFLLSYPDYIFSLATNSFSSSVILKPP